LGGENAAGLSGENESMIPSLKNQTGISHDDVACVPNFSEVAKYRNEFAGLKTIIVVHDLIGRRGPIAPILRQQAMSIRKGEPLRILDIGAYDRVLERSLASCNLVSIYHSVDIDTSYRHDFNDISDVTENYDLICMSELVEHLTLKEVDKLLHRAFALLLDGGKLYLSTPNPFHPTRYFADMTHKQHWPAPDLFAMLRHVGFEKSSIEIYGVLFRDQFSFPNAYKLIIDSVRNTIWRVLGLESRGGIIAFATKTQSNS
jgi:hypothetical protein